APGAYEAPRHRSDRFFSAVNWTDDQPEFSCIYNDPVEPPYNTFTAAQILDYVSSGFVTGMLMGDMDPQMFHQNNLHDYDGQGHSLISDAYDQAFSKYKQLYNLPVVSPTLDQLGLTMQNRNAYNLSTATASLTSASGSNLTVSITVPATATVPSAIIPITGLYSAGAEPYGGQYISHVQVSRGQTITLPVMSAPPVSVSSLTLNPTSVTGGTQSSTGTVTLSGPAPSGGAVVSLSSSNPSIAAAPSSVTVPAGGSSASFTVTTSGVVASTAVTISASYGGARRTASLTVTSTPLTLSSLTLSPTSVIGGSQSATGTVTLSGPAPSGGAVVSLSSSNPSVAAVPAGVTVPAGASTASFAVTTGAVVASTTVSITASFGGATRTASLAVTPPPVTLSSLTLNPTSVVGGVQSSTGTVTLSGPAP